MVPAELARVKVVKDTEVALVVTSEDPLFIVTVPVGVKVLEALTVKMPPTLKLALG